MANCQFFLQGRYRFGERCWNEHPRGGGGGRQGPPVLHGPGPGKGGGGPSTSNQRHTDVIQPSAAGCKDEEERLLECVRKDLEIWESSGQWIFSSYSPMKEKPNVSGFADISPEELHLEYYNCRANNRIQNFINSVQELVKQWKKRLLELKALSERTKAASPSELKNTVSQPLCAFGFGGQQTSSFGSSGFPVNSSSNPSPQGSPGCEQTAGASGHNVTSTTFGGTNYTRSRSSYTPLNELTAEELKQFKAKMFEPGKIPLRPPPIELI